MNSSPCEQTAQAPNRARALAAGAQHPRRLGAGDRLYARAGRVCQALVLAFVLALTAEGAGQAPLIQAAPAGAPVTIYVDVVNPKTTVCVGQTASYEARVYTPPANVAGFNVDRFALPGIEVQARSKDTSVGDVAPSARVTSAHEEVVDLLNPEAEPGPNSAYFLFTAKKAGRTMLSFNASAHGMSDGFPVPVRVINCEYKVIVGSKMSWSGGYGSIEFRGASVDARVKADRTGYTFTGEAPADIVWVSTSRVPGCSAVNTLGLGKVQIQGNLSDSGQLKLNLVFDRVPFKDVLTCRAGTGGGAAQVTPSALSVTVPASGGAVRLSQAMTGGPGSAPGWANVYVIPVEGAP